MIAEQLIQQITVKRENLRQLEEKLTLLQSGCAHHFVEIATHRKCKKCLKIESIHY